MAKDSFFKDKNEKEGMSQNIYSFLYTSFKKCFLHKQKESKSLPEKLKKGATNISMIFAYDISNNYLIKKMCSMDSKCIALNVGHMCRK
jgi:hypothetical protein